MNRQAVGLFHLKVLIAGIFGYRRIVFYRRTVIFFHYRTADAAADARRHLYEALVNRAAFDVFQRGYTVFHAVDCHVGIIGHFCHSLENSAGGGKKSRATEFVAVGFSLYRNVFGFHPLCKVFVRQNSVNQSFVVFRLVLFGDARTDKHDFCVRNTLFNVRRMCLHRRHDIGKTGDFFGKILLNKQIYRMTARRNYNVAIFGSHHFFVFGFNYRRAYRRFFNVIKAQLFKCFFHCGYTHAVVVCDKRRSEADDNGSSGLNEYANLFGFGRNLLGILRTHHKTLPAKNTFVTYDMRLVARKSNGLYRAVTDTFITVLTIRFF